MNQSDVWNIFKLFTTQDVLFLESESWTRQKILKRKFWYKNFENKNFTEMAIISDFGDIFEHIRHQHSVNVICYEALDKLPDFWCTPSGKMFYLNDLI